MAQSASDRCVMMRRSLTVTLLLGIFALSALMVSQVGVSTHPIVGTDLFVFADTSTTVLTETSTFTSIFSYTITTTSTSRSTTTTASTVTQTSITTFTLTTSTTTVSTFTSWRTQTVTSITPITSTGTVFFTSLTTSTATNASTSLYPTVTVTSMSISYRNTTVFSPTVTTTSTQTSVIPTIFTSTSVVATSTTTTTTTMITRPCVIASAAFGSELAPQVQFLREFRDQEIMSTFAGCQFLRVFNAFYYSFSPSVAQFVMASPVTSSLVRTLISPLVGSLLTASSMFKLFHLNSELVALFTGFVASSLIGTVYLTPVAFVRMIRKRSDNARHY